MTAKSDPIVITKDRKGLAILRARQSVCQSFSPKIGEDGHVVTDHQTTLECQGSQWLITGPSDSYRTNLEQMLLGYLTSIQSALPDQVTQVAAVDTVQDNIFS